MIGNNRKGIRQTKASLAVLGLTLALMAPFAAATGAEPNLAASSTATLEAFADGTVSKTLAFGAGTSTEASVSLRLPRDANVTWASLDAAVAAYSTVSGGAMVFDVGADGFADATASLSVLSETRVAIPASALNGYLRAHATADSTVVMPLALTGAAGGEWSVVLDGLTVEYSTLAQVEAEPTFSGEISAVGVVAGETNFSSVDLGAHFSGPSVENLTFSAEVVGGAQAGASGVEVVVNGTRADIRSTDVDGWGEVIVRFAAADASGQAALSNNVSVHVMPSPATVLTLRTEVRAFAQAVVLAPCGSPAVVERFEVPSDALITEARMALAGGLALEGLGATIEVLASAGAVASIDASDLPVAAEMNASSMNARLQAAVADWGLVELDLAVDACPSGALTRLTVANLSLTYARGPSNEAGGEARLGATIVVDGGASGSVESDASLRLALEANGSVGGETAVEWYVDGVYAGAGPALDGVTLCQGEHTIEARAATELGVHAYLTTVNASARSGAGAQIVINGRETSTVESGATLIVELRASAPLSAGAEVEWFVDGVFVGRGVVLANLTLAPGEHTVEARSSESGSVNTYTAHVSAQPVAESGNLVAALAVTGALVASAAGALLWRRSRRV